MNTPRILGRGFSLLLFIGAFAGWVEIPVFGASANVSIVDFAFNPPSVTVQPNDNVVWTWVGPTVHTATSDTALWDSGIMSAAAPQFTHTFTSSGSFPYFCQVHPFMTAAVTVQPQAVTNVPPSVAITSPVNGATFLPPWTGTIQAMVGDSDGMVTQVVFLAGSAVLGTIVNPPPNPVLGVTNLAAGNYTLKAVATDDGGASTTSAAVNISVTTQTNQPPGTTNIAVQLVGSISLNPQTGLFDQSVTVTNAGTTSVAGVRLAAPGLPTDVRLYDASGSTNGIPFADYNQPLDSGATVTFLLEYYRSNRLEFVSTNFVATVVTPSATVAPSGTVLQLDRAPFLLGGSLVIEFASVPGKTYVVEYSGDTQTWSAAAPPVVAVDTRTQWMDSGPPKTVSAPAAAGHRFYRIVRSP